MTLFDTNLLLAIVLTTLALASILLNLTLIYLIFQKTEQANMRVTWLLVTTILSIIIWIISIYLQLVIVSIDDNLLEFVIVSGFGNITVLIGLISLAVFVKYLVSPKLDLNQILTMGTIFGLTTGTYIGSTFAASFDNRDLVDILSMIANVFNLILMIMVIINIHKDLAVLLAENLSEKQRQQVRYVYMSIMTALVGLIPIILLSVLVDFNLLAIAFVIVPVALYMLNRAYLIDPRVAFILPEKTYLVLMIDNTGVPKYSRDYSLSEGQMSDVTVLISGALKAVLSLMSEFYTTPVKAKQIEFEDQQILLEWTELYFIAVFSDHDSSLLRTAMKNSISEINEKYDEKLETVMSQGKILDLDNIFDKTFYFIYR